MKILTSRRVLATLMVAPLMIIVGYVTYRWPTVAGHIGIPLGETVSGVLLVPLLLLTSLAGLAGLVFLHGRDKVAQILREELDRADSDESVTALRDSVWPTAADVADYLETRAAHPFGELHERVMEPAHVGRHRASALAQTAEFDVTELLDDTEPKLFTHEQLFGQRGE